jgi:hypothetical protein
MSIDIEPLSDAAGLTVTDHIENTQFEVYTDRLVDPAASPEDASEALALLCLPEARWLNGEIIRNDGAGIFAYMGRFGQAWAMVPDEAVMPDTSGSPMLGDDRRP